MCAQVPTNEPIKAPDSGTVTCPPETDMTVFQEDGGDTMVICNSN